MEILVPPVSVLLIEDATSESASVRERFSSAESPVTLTESGSLTRTRELLSDKEHGFDCILLDLILPNGEGLDLIKEVRAICGEMVIIVYTSRTDEKLASYFDAGADDFLSKDVPARQVEAAVLSARRRSAIRRRRSSRWVALAEGIQALERQTGRLLEHRTSSTGKHEAVGNK